MIYVGIDIAKLNLFATVLKLFTPSFLIYAPESMIIGLELTAHYGDNLIRYLVANDYIVCVLNPSDFFKTERSYPQDED